MSKKLIIPNRLKRICTFLLMLVVALTLSSCDSSNRKSTGALDLNAEYLSNGNLSVNVGELYDSLRATASSYVVDRTYQIVYAEEIEEVKNNLDKYKEKLDETINKAIYETSDEEEIAKLDSKAKNTKILTYIDTMFKKGYVITKDQIVAKDFATLYPYYYLDVAKYLGAREKLASEFKTKDDGTIDFGNIDDKSYFTENDIINYYKDNYKNTGNVEALLIRFVSSTEASSILKLFGIKAYDGSWYQIKLDEEKPTTKVAYDKYYDNYTVNPTGTNGDTSIEYIANGKATILRIFVEIYNYIYTYREKIQLDGMESLETFLEGKDENDPLRYYDFIQEIIQKGHDLKESNPDNTEYADIVAKLKEYDAKIKADDSSFETIIMSNEKLKKYGDNLASYVYSTLATEPSEEGKAYTQYSSSAKSYGDYYYLVFKIAQEKDQELYTEETDDDNKTTYTFTNEDLKQEILMKLFEEKIDDSYITSCFEERLNKTKLYIYDSMVELHFMYSNSSKLVDKYEKTKKKNNNLVAAVKYNKKTTNITVSEAYAYLEPLYGPQQSLILLFNKYIKTTDYYTKLEKDYDNYVKTIETMLYYFTNDSYSSYGYPSAMGKYNFMLMYFNTANIKDAVYNSLMVSDAESQYYLDFVSKGFVDNSFYESLKTYADKTFDDYYSLTATSINVYTDKDEDGEKDEMNAETKELANELIKKIIAKAKNSHSNYATAITKIISDYNDSTRFSSDNPTTLEYEWSKYRIAGLFIEKEEIGEITNTTDKNTEIKERIHELYPTLVNAEYGFTSSYLDDEEHIIETETGYTTLLISAGSTATSAKYDNEKELYKDVTIILNDKKETVSFNSTSFDSTKASIEAIKVYVAEYLKLSDVYSLPEATITALDAYLLPLLQRYTSSASQHVQIVNALGSLNYKITDAVNPANDEAFNSSYTRVSYLNKYIETLQNSADSYDSTTYPNWWTNMYKGGSN